MNISGLATHVDGLLTQHGFVRKGWTWNSCKGSSVGVIDLQIGKTKDAVTVNVGVLCPEVYRLCWGKEVPSFVEEPECTVRARIGELSDGKDLWWAINDENINDGIISKISAYALPFIERMQSRKEMENHLIQSGVLTKKYPLPAMALATLKAIDGHMTEACEILNDLTKRVVGPWRIRVSEVAKRIGCM